jgi:tetratricopeptide (TPR) repeat protein
MGAGVYKAFMKIFFAALLVSTASLTLAQQSQASREASEVSTQSAPATTIHKPDKAAAYYHFTMAHMYEEEMQAYGRSDLVSKAIEEYRQAIEADPTSEYLTAGLAEIYARTGRIREAVNEAQEILKRDPQNLEAHRLLGHIYLRSLGDMQNGSGSDNVLKLAIEQYEEIVRLDPSSNRPLRFARHFLTSRFQEAQSSLLRRAHGLARNGTPGHDEI